MTLPLPAPAAPPPPLFCASFSACCLATSNASCLLGLQASKVQEGQGSSVGGPLQEGPAQAQLKMQLASQPTAAQSQDSRSDSLQPAITTAHHHPLTPPLPAQAWRACQRCAAAAPSPRRRLAVPARPACRLQRQRQAQAQAQARRSGGTGGGEGNKRLRAILCYKRGEKPLNTTATPHAPGMHSVASSDSGGWKQAQPQDARCSAGRRGMPAQGGDKRVCKVAGAGGLGASMSRKGLPSASPAHDCTPPCSQAHTTEAHTQPPVLAAPAGSHPPDPCPAATTQPSTHLS